MVLLQKAAVNKMRGEPRRARVPRLHSGARESIDSSSIHMGVPNDLKRINSHATNVAHVAVGEL